MTKKDYITNYWAAAQEACKGTPIFPILALAESAVESSWGESLLTKKGANYFGIKAFNTWKGKIVTLPTTEYINGKKELINANFRAYDNPVDCFKDYIKVVTGTRYKNAGVLDAKTPQEQIECIAKAGYSTSPVYAKTIIQVMDGLEPLVNINLN
jgi:peptidoglycan hydrolase FlgJ